MTAILQLQAPYRRAIFLAAIPIFLIFLYFAQESSFVPDDYKPLPFSRGLPADKFVNNFVEAVYQHGLHPIDAPFEDEDHHVFNISQKPYMKKPLGKKMLILDIDSRPLTNEGELMSQGLKWKGIRALSAGMLSHYLYAQIHGYDYKFIRAPDYEDRWGTWVKVPVMKEALKSHDYVMFMDSDVIIRYPHIPAEWLMNHWNMTKETLVMMAQDPDEPQNYDQKEDKKLLLNTGFVIAQNSPRTQEMYDAWTNCPTETRYKGCAHWKLDWAHEQAAFGNFLRYDFNRTNEVVTLPCAEANGAPEAAHRGNCTGTFVRHYWINKGLVPEAFASSVMQYLVPQLHSQFHGLADQNIVDAKGFKFVGSDLVPMTEEEKAEMRNKEGKNQKEEGW